MGTHRPRLPSERSTAICSSLAAFTRRSSSWDHEAVTDKAFLDGLPSRGLPLAHVIDRDRLPEYAHELNLVERVWSVLKRSLANLVKRDLGQLRALVRTRLRRMQYRPGLLEGFLAGTGLDFTPFSSPHH
jgi:transposase